MSNDKIVFTYKQKYHIVDCLNKWYAEITGGRLFTSEKCNPSELFELKKMILGNPKKPPKGSTWIGEWW